MIIKLDRTAFKRSIWKRARQNNLSICQEKLNNGSTNEESNSIAINGLKKNIVYAMKNFGRYYEKTLNRELSKCDFKIMELAVYSMRCITPRMFMGWFPIEKEYDGETWGTRDYFSTMEYIKRIGIDNKIEEPLYFLFEYHNWEILLFVVNYTALMSDEYAELTGNSIMDQFFIEHEIY